MPTDVPASLNPSHPMKLELTDRNLQRYHLTGTLVVVVVLALALAGSLL